jgi:nucleotide-binding universal stress UspA family protein
MRILLCTDGSRQADNTLRFGALIAQVSHGKVTVLSVAESGRDVSRIQWVLAHSQTLLVEASVPAVETRVRLGHADEQILAEVEAGGYDLLVVGSRGRRGVTRFMLGSTAERLARLSPIPVVIVRGERPALKRVLVCTGGTSYGEADARMGGEIARLTGAQVTVLHVMSQVPLTPTANLIELEVSAEDAMARNTREGQHLKQTLAILQQAGVGGKAKLRRGLVVDEILAEAQEGDYDLLVVGAHTASGRFTFLLDDVCNQIINYADRPVLVVRAVNDGQDSGETGSEVRTT